MRVAMIGVLLLTVILVVSPLAAQNCEGCDPVEADVGSDPCPTYSECSMYITGNYNGQYITIEVACKKASCRTCDTRNRCVSVYLNANCTCDDEPVPNAGPNITACTNQNGSCVVR